MKTKEREKKPGRPREAKPIRNKDGTLSVRTTLEVEGETVRRMVNLGTSDRAVAKARALRLARGESPELFEKKSASFAEVAEELMAQATIRTAKERISRLRRYAFPVLGDMTPGDIRVSDLRACLEKVESELGWTNTVRHLKNDLSAILGELYSDGVIDENAALRISFKKKPVRRVVALRVVLTDEEFTRFIEHGLSLSEGGALPELYMLALCARCLGGMRTSDLHAWRWEHLDRASWGEARVPRPKTQGPAAYDEDGDRVLEPYELPGALAPHLSAWWRRHGCPSEGPVFPVRRGIRAGLHKRPRSSYAKDLRDALWAAGVVRPLPGYEQARPEDRRRLCSLQEGIAGKRACVDFHSFRRAWVTATTSQKGLSIGESMRLADHSDPATHLRYRRDENRRVIPEGVVPSVPAPAPSPPAREVPRGGFWQ